MRRFQLLVIITALFGLGIGGAFGSGVWYGRKNAPAVAQSATATPAAGGGLAALGGGGGAGGFTAGGSGATTGTVEEVNGEEITVRTSAGGTVAIKLQPDTTVRTLTTGTSADIRPGVNVVVTGQVDLDNKVAARSVQITPAGAGGGQGGGAAGAGGGRGGGAATSGTATRPAGTAAAGR